MTIYQCTFHQSKPGSGTVPTISYTLQADSLEAAIAEVEAMTWPENAVRATLQVTGRANVVITR
jgi:hypothetical protein